MNSAFFKISFKIGLVTAGLMVLCELTNQLLVYHYFDYQYYIAGSVIIALITGIVLANRHHREKAHSFDRPLLESLTAKELCVLTQIAEGKSNKEIAALNYIEVSTVKTHVNNIFSKLGVKNRKEAAKIYRQQAETQKSILSPPTGI